MNCLNGIFSSFNQLWEAYRNSSKPVELTPVEPYVNPPNSLEPSQVSETETKED